MDLVDLMISLIHSYRDRFVLQFVYFFFSAVGNDHPVRLSVLNGKSYDNGDQKKNQNNDYYNMIFSFHRVLPFGVLKNNAFLLGFP